MKYFIIVFMLTLIGESLLSSEYNYNTEGIGTASTKTMTLSNGTKFLLYENSIGWTDNLGNYGKSFCYGRIKIVDDIADKFNLICESLDQNGDKNWVEFSRADTNMDAGSGNSRYVDGTGIYKKFIGSECIFSTKYLEDRLFFKSKCKLNTKIIEELARK